MFIYHKYTYISSFEAGICVSNYSFKWMKVETNNTEAEGFPANTRRWPSAGLMLAQRRRRWVNISPALGQRLVFSGLTSRDRIIEVISMWYRFHLFKIINGGGIITALNTIFTTDVAITTSFGTSQRLLNWHLLPVKTCSRHCSRDRFPSVFVSMTKN